MNLFTNLPANLTEEEILPLLAADDLRIERIVSTGQSSPAGFWYDQAEHEWVLVLRGHGVVEFEKGERISLAPGDHLHIAPHVRHRVSRTSREEPTVWLAVFWRAQTVST
jgi:cupin 2 domain-containing protein